MLVYGAVRKSKDDKFYALILGLNNATIFTSETYNDERDAFYSLHLVETALTEIRDETNEEPE